ncbi:MAG: S8 family serine peptidase [Oscillospiraceae bacterium]|nr:S8 family serine peptidase [Oscillospiraceae bacterium]
MLRKIISTLLIFSLCVMNIPAIAVDINTTELVLPEDGNELGYLFGLSDSSPDIDVSKYPEISLVSSLARIYFAQDLDDIKNISGKFDIEYVEPNMPISEPEPIESDDEIIINDDIISLFTDEIDTVEDETTDSETTDTSTLNDPLYPYQRGHIAVNASAYYDNGITGEGVKVGIIDTGINRDHSAFNGVNVETGINVLALLRGDEDRIYETGDTWGHGTAVASIICSTINDGVGIAGITDKVTVVPYRVFDDTYGESSSAGIDAALEFAYEDGCDVVNISMGSSGFSKSDYSLIETLTNLGMIIIASAGNDGRTTNDLTYPAAYDNVIGVGAVEPDGCNLMSAVSLGATDEILMTGESVSYSIFSSIYDDVMSAEYSSPLFKTFSVYAMSDILELSNDSYVKCDFSNANEGVFVSAPGTYMCGPDAYVTGTDYFDNNRYKANLSGTSFASPVIAAAAVGAKQMLPDIDQDGFKTILMATSIDLDEESYDENTGYGMVDFAAIYEYITNAPESPETPVLDSITYNPDTTLADVELPDNWVWVDSSIVPTVNNEGYTAYYDTDYSNEAWSIIDGYNSETGRVERVIELDVVKAEGSASITMESYAHGDAVPKPVITSETNLTTGATYTYAVNGSDEYTSTVPTDVGEYTVKAVLPESDNYNEVTVTADFTISHNYNKTSYDSESHWNECSCGDKESSEAHTLSDWTITKKPTQTETGTAQRSCTGCGYSKQITLSSLSDTSVWQATECVEATEDSDGYIEYTSEYGTVIIILLFEDEDEPSDEYDITVSFSSESGTDVVECNVKNNTNTLVFNLTESSRFTTKTVF